MKIGLLDHMGYGNLGDAATQDALIANIKQRAPDAVLVAFSLSPDDTRSRHNISSYSINWWHSGLNKSHAGNTANRQSRFQFKSLLKRIRIFSSIAKRVLYLVREVVHLRRSFTVVRSLDSLVIAGGGQLAELWRGPWSHPYNVLKFSLLAKLARRKLLFLNVGAGPVNRALSKLFVRWAVSLGDYVSFRDVESQELVHGLGVKRPTHVCADSAYSLDVTRYRTTSSVRVCTPLVGINPIGFCDPRIWPRKDSSLYWRYLDKLAAFSLWLLAQNYRLRIFSGEKSVDVYALEDLKKRLVSAAPSIDPDEVFRPPCETVEEVLLEISRMDFVVTSKFHGAVFCHLLEKPVVALSYHRKFEDLMRAVGHVEYCKDIEDFDEAWLRTKFTCLAEHAEELKARFRLKTAANAASLREQFDELFLPPESSTRRPSVYAASR
jgi:polysaccharide pyruvyl transferase WcaK-like protein